MDFVFHFPFFLRQKPTPPVELLYRNVADMMRSSGGHLRRCLNTHRNHWFVIFWRSSILINILIWWAEEGEKQRGRETLLMNPDKIWRSQSGCKQTGSESTWQKKKKRKKKRRKTARQRRRWSPSLVLPAEWGKEEVQRRGGRGEER